MIKVIPIEDWLRDCVHHDGRHGYVTLPCDEVLKIADLIERLKADRKTEPQTYGILFKGNLKEGDYKLIKTSNGWVLEGNDIAYYGEPQTERRSE